MRKTVVFVLAIALAVVMTAGQAFAQAKVLKISNGINEQHPSYLANKKFGEILNAKLPGKYNVQVYANAQLGDDVRATEAVRMGTLEMVTTSASPLTGLVPEFNVFDLPFIIPSEKAADAVFDGPIGAKLAAALEAKGIKLLAYYENGFRQLTNSARAVSSPADLNRPAAQPHRRAGTSPPDDLALQVLRGPEVCLTDRPRLRTPHRSDRQEALGFLSRHRPEDHRRRGQGVGRVPACPEPQDEQRVRRQPA